MSIVCYAALDPTNDDAGRFQLIDAPIGVEAGISWP
jgi:hypothetical protein